MTCSVSAGARVLETALGLLGLERLAAPAALELGVLGALAEALDDRERDQTLRDQGEDHEEDEDEPEGVAECVTDRENRHRHEHTFAPRVTASGGAPHAQQLALALGDVARDPV